MSPELYSYAGATWRITMRRSDGRCHVVEYASSGTQPRAMIGVPFAALKPAGDNPVMAGSCRFCGTRTAIRRGDEYKPCSEPCKATMRRRWSKSSQRVWDARRAS